MSIDERAAPLVRAAALAVLATMLGACATGGPAPGPLSAQSRVINQLTAECYWQSEGERLIFGAPQVHSACRVWARERVKVRMPEGHRTLD